MNTNHTGKFTTTVRHVHPLPGDVMLTSLKSFHSPCTWPVTMLQRDAKSLSFQTRGHPIRQIWIQWTTASGVSFKRGSTVRGSMTWRSWNNVCWGSGGCWTTPLSRQRLRNGVCRLNACVRVNGGHFEHKFWVSDFLLCFLLVFLNVIDINICKVLILCEMCYFCVWDFQTVS